MPITTVLGNVPARSGLYGANQHLTKSVGKLASGGFQSLAVQTKRAAYNDNLATSNIDAIESLETATISPTVSRRDVLRGVSVVGAASLALDSRLAWAGSEQFSLNLEDRVNEFTLDNGLKFIILERHKAPIVSCHVHVNIGAYDEKDGKTGIAHLMEHIAFKGTQRIGTHNYQQEALLLDAIDEVFYSLRDLQDKTSPAKEELETKLAELEAKAADYSIVNDFGTRLERNGAVGLNATTSQDATKYFVSLPANKLELWFAMESERFQVPVFRELYSEKRVVAEERRLRIESSPLGRFQEAFARNSLTNNYRRPVIGYAEDVERLGRREVEEFFLQHYVPSNLCISIVGDINSDEVHKLAEKYFGGWSMPKDDSIAEVAVHEPLPKSGGLRRLEQQAQAGPLLMEAFYHEGLYSPDAAAWDALSGLLSGSRTSRFNNGLIQGGLAYSATSNATYLGQRHANAFLVLGIPQKGVSLDALRQAMHGELKKLADEGPTQQELLALKKGSKLSLIEAIKSNASMASTLATYTAYTGNWRGLLQDMQDVEELTSSKVAEVAQRLFTEDNCFTGYVYPEKA